MTTHDEWIDVTLPFLKAVHARLDDADGAGMKELALLGTGTAVERRWKTIENAGLASGTVMFADQGVAVAAMGLHLEAAGLRAIGAWPSAGQEVALLIQLLEAKIESTTDDQERSALAKVRDAVVAVGREPGRAALQAAVKAAVDGAM